MKGLKKWQRRKKPKLKQGQIETRYPCFGKGRPKKFPKWARQRDLIWQR